jgi:hypothetical protein
LARVVGKVGMICQTVLAVTATLLLAALGREDLIGHQVLAVTATVLLAAVAGL